MTADGVFLQIGVNGMFHNHKKSARIISGIIIIVLVLAMLASMLLYLL